MKKIYKNYWLICLVFLGFLSCNNDDGEVLFAESPAERIAGQNSELLNLLTSEQNGYKGTYFTKNDEFGGFTFYMKFNADGSVDMTSDFDSDTAIESSSYDVRYGTTNELVFTTRNHIQKVSDPQLPGLVGTGFKGTSVFQYFGSQDGKLTFKDIRNRDSASFVLEPSQLTDFETESVAKVETTLAEREKLLTTPERSVFQLLRIENSNGDSDFNLNYNPDLLFAKPRITFDDGSVTEFSFGVLFEENGLVINPTLEFEGESYTYFSYDADSGSYISTVNGTTATILFGNEPAFIDKDIDDIVELGPTGFLYRPGLGSNPLTSLGFDALLEEISDNFAAFPLGEWLVNDVQFTIDYESDNCDTYLYIQLLRVADGATFTAFYCFEKAVINDRKLFLTYSGPSGGNAPFFEPLVMPLIDFFSSSEGLIYSAEGGFSSTLFSFSNTAGTFTSVENPSLRVYGLWFG